MVGVAGIVGFTMVAGNVGRTGFFPVGRGIVFFEVERVSALLLLASVSELPDVFSKLYNTGLRGYLHHRQKKPFFTQEKTQRSTEIETRKREREPGRKHQM